MILEKTIKENYTDLGIFITKQKAMEFRDENYKWCSCYTEKEKDKTRLWIKLPT